jgi:hypothetical protein
MNVGTGGSTVIEFLQVTRALNADPHEMIRKITRGE